MIARIFAALAAGMLLSAAPAAAQGTPVACTSFSGFPLVIQLGSRVGSVIVGSESPLCANTKIQAAINALANQRGVPNGIAMLGADGKIASSLLPPILIPSNVATLGADGLLTPAQAPAAVATNAAAIAALNGKVGAASGIATLGSDSTLSPSQAPPAIATNTAALAALNAKLGAANGVATLGADGKVPSVQLPPFATASSLPRVYAAVAGSVIADNATDQAANINTAVGTCPSTGCILVLPCGKVAIGTLTVSAQNIIIEGGGQYCTTLVSLNTTGAVMRMTGNYSGVRDLGFQQKGAVVNSSDNTVTGSRTSGFTLDLAGAYQFVERASFQHCYRCINMGFTAGYGYVSQVDMTYLTSAATAAGSGGIVVNNPAYGPNNWITRALIYGNTNAPPNFGIRVQNSGATIIDTFDVLGFNSGLLVNPGTGGTSQALRVANGYFDSSQGDAVLFQPTGDGYIFESRFVNAWIVSTIASGTNGFKMQGNLTTPAAGRLAIRNTSFVGGTIAHSGSGGDGVVCTDAGVSDTTISGTLVAGWNIGVHVGQNCSNVTVTNNSIGTYSPFSSAGNVNGIYLDGGTTNDVLISGNRMIGNSTQTIYDASTGSRTRIVDNVGYNGLVNATNVSVTGSGMGITNGHTPATYYINGGSGVSTVAVNGNITLSSGTPAAVSLGPNEAIVLNYSSAPANVTRAPH